MASPYVLSNTDLQYTQVAGQRFSLYLAFLNPISITTTWNDINQDAQGNWLPPPNFDTAANRVQPYAPTANLGPNRIGFVGEPLYFDGSFSCQRFDLPVVTYAWFVSGTGIQTTLYANGSQCRVVFPSPGIYTISLTVTDRAGTAATGVRQVMVYQDRQSALPGMIQLSGPQGSLSDGGWTCQINTISSQFTLFPPDALPVGTYQPVVLMVETSFEVQPGVWLDRTLGPNGQFNPGFPYQDPRILFDGYVQTGSPHQDVDKDTLSFTCASVQLLLNDAQCHLIGYYNCAYKSIVSGVPTGCNPNPMGQGYMVGGLMTADIYHGILQDHSNIGKFHDIHVWNANIPTAAYNAKGNYAYYNLMYTTLSVNEGTIWSNLQDLSANEFAQVYCEHDGSIRVGPQVNYRGGDYWSLPWGIGPNQASIFINLVQDLGFTVSNQLSQMGSSIPQLPAQPMPIRFVHPWGPQNTLPSFGRPFQGTPDPTQVTVQNTLNGPPILCVFSDIPIYDSSLIPPGSNTGLLPYIILNWPQDLAVYPITFDFQENYTGKASLVKLIGTLVNISSVWTCWYPQNTFSVAGDGTDTIVATVLPAGNWIVDESHVLPDVTGSQNTQLMLNYWWEMARRTYFANNINYNGTIATGMSTFASLGDIVAVTRQNNTLGPHWSQKLFYIDGISYSIDTTQRTWQTQYTLTEVTSAAIGPVLPPPKVTPKL